jgi:hypothetical protein
MVIAVVMISARVAKKHIRVLGMRDVRLHVAHSGDAAHLPAVAQSLYPTLKPAQFVRLAHLSLTIGVSVSVRSIQSSFSECASKKIH